MAKQFKPETLCVQAGWTPKKGEPRVLPIYQSTTFKYDTSAVSYTHLTLPTNSLV